MKQASFGEIALKLGINKSKLAYYHSIGLLIPVAKFGKMNVFDQDEVLRTLKQIEKQKKNGIKLKDFKVK